MLIAVEGCVGSGKTTLAKMLRDHRKSKLLLEEFEKNPFLQEFYEQPEQHVLETELAFVMIHYHQMKTLLVDHDAVETVIDFFFLKDQLFADMNIRDPKEKQVFQAVFDFLYRKVPAPELIVYLKCSDSLILRRIKNRNQASETKIDPEYFRQLNRHYNDFMGKVDIPKITVNMDDHDFFADPSHIEWLSSEVNRTISETNLKPS